MEISQLQTSVIKPYKRNNKLHDSKQLDRIAESIKEFGFNQPIVVDEKNTILVGHGRHLAAQQLEMKTVPAVVLKGLSEEQKTAYRILDNKLAHDSDWDMDALQAEMQTLIDADYELEDWGLSDPILPKTKTLKIDELKEHPRNYKVHPADQLQHLMQSIKDYGIYRNVIIASDSTILSGHGVVAAAKQLGLKHVPVLQLSIAADDVRAIKLLALDNEISHLAEVDDRKLSVLLKEVLDADGSLLGTGYDEAMLANLLFVTRPVSEIADLNEAAEWVGMPEFELSPQPRKLIVQFESEEAKHEFCTRNGYAVSKKHVDSVWWPPKDREKFVGDREFVIEDEE